VLLHGGSDAAFTPQPLCPELISTRHDGTGDARCTTGRLPRDAGGRRDRHSRTRRANGTAGRRSIHMWNNQYPQHLHGALRGQLQTRDVHRL